MSEFTFLLHTSAPNFVTREVGRQIREKLLKFEASVPVDQRITIDASGVRLVTPSFVDEFFGRTAAKFGLERFRDRFRILGVDDQIKSLINNVVRNRLILDSAACSLNSKSSNSGGDHSPKEESVPTSADSE